MHALLLGFSSSLALIVAIGAQNAFVLRQGLRREHVAPVVAICLISDALLIGAGVAGLSAIIRDHPGFVDLVRVVGATFLVVYGLVAFRRVLRPNALTADGGNGRSRRSAVVAALGFTFLNPHVYLDTVLLLGSIGAQQPSAHQPLFVAGGVAASAIWFSGLGFGARFLAPIFARPAAWRVLDSTIGVVMWTLAILLLTGA